MSVRLSAIACFLAAAFLVSVPEGRGEEFHNALSLQGFTGILNTPNAAVTDEGKFYALYSDQEENSLRRRLRREESYMFSVGMFRHLELGGRLTDAPYNDNRKKITDLSANVKLRVPFIPEGEYIPRFALGVQDLGGGAHHFRTAYAVASEEIWHLRLSVGYGTGGDRMKGLFGGAELKALDWLYLLGEYDTRETNVGVRLVSPELFGIPVNLHFTAKASIDHNAGSPELGIGFQIPLGRDHWSRKPVDVKQPASDPGAPVTDGTAKGSGEPVTTQAVAGSALLAADTPAPDGEGRRTALLALRDRLVADGFQNVRVGEGDGGLLVVEFENSRYNHNELDGIGVVTGMIADGGPAGFDTLRLVLRKKGIRVMQLSAPLAEMRAFLHDGERLEKLRDVLQVTPDVTDDQGVRFVDGSANPSWLHATLVVAPDLKTFVGTDFSTFDYLLSVKPDLYLNTWKGAVVNARWDIPVSWSEGFDDDKPYRANRQESRLDRLMLFQAVKLAPTVMATIGAGMVLHETYGTLNELLWSPGEGDHRFRLRHAYGENSDTKGRNESYLASYRYRYAPLDLYLEGTAGRFWGRDTGFTVEMKRFFGDTAFSLVYKNTENPANERVQVGGVQFSFPLTPRRDMKPYPVQLKGTDEWAYAQEIEIASPGEANLVGRTIAINPQPAFNLANVFYNRDRLNEAYIKRHLLRLRDAYLRYVLK